ncbi:MAG: ABC transporter ATP-binding protein [Candidatus Poribacteria bacterium]|nr:ABC transporter ATP-binding protein [Candidatus Poribacteria bacterium]MDE0506601.1 ABC transporter ATP-binding protein [Candidatus Poribacteria bacterium]
MNYFLRLLGYARPYLFRLSLVFLLILLLGQAGLFMPLMQKFIIDDILLRSRDSLASIDLNYQDDLDTSQRLSDELLRNLETERISLSPDTRVSIEETGRRWKLIDQETGEEYAVERNDFKMKSKLDSLPEDWRRQLNDIDVLLSSEATIAANDENKGWIVTDSEKLYTILPDGDKLIVYEGEFRTLVGTVAFTVPEEWRRKFQDNGVLLSPKATIVVGEDADRWTISDDDKRHTAQRNGKELEVHEGELKIYAGTITFPFFGNRYTRTPVGWLIVALITIVSFFAVLSILRYIQTFSMTWVSQRILFDLRNHVFSHLQSLSMRFYDLKGTGQILSRVREDVAALRSLVTTTTIDIITDIVTVIVMLVIMFSWHWKLTLLSLAVMPLIVGNYFFFIRRLRPLWRQWRDKWADISTGMYEAVAGAKVVKAFGRERHHELKLFRDMRTTFEWEIKVTQDRTAMQRIALFFRTLGRGIVLSYGGYLVVRGDFTVGSMIAFVTFLERMQQPIMSLININATIQEAMVSTERVFGLLDSEPTVEESEDAVSLPEMHGHVKFEDVQFSYEPENPVLHDINLEAQPGMMVALVGPSGCGKTTVANLIARFYDPTGGSLYIDGFDLKDVTIKSLRNQLGIVLQENFLFDGSVAENIRFGRPNASDEEVVQAALAANAHQFIVEQLPEGYETKVGERGMRLSGGQKQRLSIARTILRDPRILILDEATSSLDTQSEEQIQQALDRLMKARTSFVIAHRLSTVLKADLIVVMNEGRIVETGTHEQLMETGGMYAEMYNKQFKTKSEGDDSWLK